jgi:hypothetical protein
VVFAFVPLMEAQFASQIRLPNTPDITAHFGVHKGRKEQANCTMGMASVFYDVLNYLVINQLEKLV